MTNDVDATVIAVLELFAAMIRKAQREFLRTGIAAYPLLVVVAQNICLPIERSVLINP